LIPLQVDPPDHLRYRRMLDPLFTPPKMAKLEADVANLTNRCIDRFIEDGQCDFASQFAVPIPSGTFLHLLGLPIERLDEFMVFKDAMIRPRGETPEEAHANLQKAGQWVFNMFNEALEERANQLTDDVLGHLWRLEQAGELSREESLNICQLLLSAGLDTVTDSLECSLVFLARSPEHQQRLAADGGLVPKAVEELLRWMCPVPTVARVMMDDADVEGCPVPAGTKMSVMLATLNIDPSRFEDPSRVDFERQANKHASFGLGVHRCLGSHLARRELRVTLREWHRRIPEYTLKPGIELHYARGLRSVENLELEW
jgi:cytochrome P450